MWLPLYFVIVHLVGVVYACVKNDGKFLITDQNELVLKCYFIPVILYTENETMARHLCGSKMRYDQY